MGSLLPPHHNHHFRYHFPHRRRPTSGSGFGPTSGSGRLSAPVALAVVVLRFVVLATAVVVMEAVVSSPAAVAEVLNPVNGDGNGSVDPTMSPLSSSSSSSLQWGQIPVQATLLCDNFTYQECLDNAATMKIEAENFNPFPQGSIPQTPSSSSSSSPSAPPRPASIALNVSVVRIPHGGPEALRTLGPAVEKSDADVLVAVGGSDTVQTATVLAQGLDKPLLGYVHDDSWKDTYKPLTNEDYLSANADQVSQGATLALLIGQYNLAYSHIIIQDIYLGSGFLEGFSSKGHSKYASENYQGKSTLESQVTDEQIELMLEDLSLKGWKIIVLHCQPHLMLRVLKHTLAMNLFGTGYGWFLSETAMTYDPEELKTLPPGLLGLRGFYHNRTSGLLRAVAQTVSCAYACMQECFSDILLPPVPSNLSSSSSLSSLFSSASSPASSSSSPPSSSSSSSSVASSLLSSLLALSSQSPSLSWKQTDPSSSEGSSISSPLSLSPLDSSEWVPLQDSFRVSCNDTTHYFTRCVRYSPLCRQREDTAADGSSRTAARSNSSSHRHSHKHSSSKPAHSLLQSGAAYYLLNLVQDKTNERMWESVGYISSSGHTNLKTVMWPGKTIFSPSAVTEKTYRVVTRPAKPFVYAEGPVGSNSDCFTDIPCLQLKNSSKEYVIRAINHFLSRAKGDQDMDYSVYCCKGISLEILHKLSEDLSFQYVVYLVNDSNYGEFTNNTWTGMVGDIVGGSAELIMGAFSMTPDRMQAISYSEPFYQNEFSLVTGEDGRSPSIWAFLSPFSAQVWTCILLSSIVAGVATSSLEWFSPFGLNPRGRKRTKQYSLGSGLLMVWVLVTGHTINIKAPKSWPSKVIQNVWAGLAIFIMTSYTANLAAYLAGQSAIISLKSIYDSKLLQKRVAVVKSSAVEHLLELINPDLYQMTRNNYVNSTADGILQLKSDQIDVYLDDYQLLEYEVSRLDKECEIQFVGKGFGSDVYAIGLPKNSWMRSALSNKILSYTESGFIQELSKKYMMQSRCGYFLTGSAVQYGLEHTGGLFIILLTAVFVSVLLLVLEHLAYKFLIPWFRSRPACSFWKTENMAFISQRVHRVVRSEKLYSQKQAAQEMIKIVKQRDFTRLIQKNELQKRKMPPQKRLKTKAEMFQEITANIVSYHRQLKEPESADLDDAVERDEDFITYDLMQGPDNLVHGQMAAAAFLDENYIGLNNLAYYPDEDRAGSVIEESASGVDTTDNDEDDVDREKGRREKRGRQRAEMNNARDYDEDGVGGGGVGGGGSGSGGGVDGGVLDEEDRFDESNEISLSSPAKRSSRSSNSSLWSCSPRRKPSVASSSASRDRKDRSPSISVFGASASEPTSPVEPVGDNLYSWQLPRGVGLRASGSQLGHSRSPQRRRVSDVSPMRLPNGRPVKNNASRSHSQDYQNWDYFQRNLKMKDNRVKSTLRSHALSGYQSQVPADFLDECTLDALSKEDLLILWKKSELELQSKLRDVLNRNRRLALAIDYLTKEEDEDGGKIGEEV